MRKRNFSSVYISIIALLASLIIGALLLIITGYNPIESYYLLFDGAFGNLKRFSETLVKMIPILIIALGTSVAFKAKLWNIGGNGQYTLGAIAAATVALYVKLPVYIVLPLAFLASILVGTIYGLFIGGIKAKLNANEVITTLMMDYIIAYLLSYLVYGPMMDPDGFGFPQTSLLDDKLMFIKVIGGTRLHFGIFIALLLVIFVYLLWKSKKGFSILLVGDNPLVAKFCGINVSKHIILTMCISASISALAGCIDVFGIFGRLQDNLPGSLGSIAIVVALLGNLNPVGITFASLFFAALVVGGNTMQRFGGVPYALVSIIQGLVIVFVISGNMIYRRRK